MKYDWITDKDDEKIMEMLRKRRDITYNYHQAVKDYFRNTLLGYK